MPVAPLPESTLRALCSSLVLVDAASVVKELIDNALDAGASTISIEISANTLDVIQVKDNGSGIAAEDRAILCRPGCTSKIRTVQDLERLGGSSLGFRGEALASVVELSQLISITTRVEGEVVGSTLRYGQSGTVFSSCTASHPVGTTIRVQEFLKKIPVRRQTAIKAATKTLNAIKQTLQAYAFARPSVRLSLKVLRGKNEKANWTYVPKPGSVSLEDTTAKIVGQDVAAQCLLSSSTSARCNATESTGAPYSLCVFLPRTDADSSKVGNAGHFISIDGRPVTSLRGTMKEVVKLYRTYYRNAVAKHEGSPTSVDPFLCLHLRCPVGSYDVNIEPTKDEVLFIDSSCVVSLTEELFKNFYGELENPTRTLVGPKKPRDHSIGPDAGFDLLMARKSPSASILLQESGLGIKESRPSHNRFEQDDSIPLPDIQPTQLFIMTSIEPRVTSILENDEGAAKEPTNHRMQFNMHTMEDDDIMAMDPPPLEKDPSFQTEEDCIRNVNVTNPWALAKLSASVQQSKITPDDHQGDACDTQLMTPSQDQYQSSFWAESEPRAPQASRKGKSYLPSPTASVPSPGYQNPGPPKRPWRPPRCVDRAGDEIEFRPEPTTGNSRTQHAAVLDKWVKPNTPFNAPSFRRASELCVIDGQSAHNSVADYSLHKESLDSTSSAQLDETEGETPPNRGITAPRKPFSTPFRTPRINTKCPATAELSLEKLPSVGLLEAPSIVNLEGASTMHANLLQPNLITEPEQVHALSSVSQLNLKSSQSTQQDLAQILDFEHRKKAAIAQQRKAYSKIPSRHSNTAQLHTEPRTVESSPITDHPTGPTQIIPSLNVTGKEGTSSEAFKQRFGDSVEEAEIGIERQSPHKNRYLAAKDRLLHSRPEPHTHIEGKSRHISTSDRAQREIISTDQPFKFLDGDPRGYLSRHLQGPSAAISANSNDHSRAGFKVRRTKSARLPLETIPIGAAIHDLNAVPSAGFPSAEVLRAACNRLEKTDRYLTTGQNELVVWSAYSRDVETWQKTLSALMTEHFRARVNGGAEVVVPDMPDIALARRIHAHVDNNAVQ